MPQELRVSIGQHSLAGPKPVNQDFHGAVVPTGPKLASKGVAGAGRRHQQQPRQPGGQRGRVCAAFWRTTTPPPSLVGAPRRPVRAGGHQRLAACPDPAQRRPLRPDRGYVCTFSALILKGREGHLLHVGDSRIYRLHPQALEALTEDHRVRLSSAESHLARALGADATSRSTTAAGRWPKARSTCWPPTAPTTTSRRRCTPPWPGTRPTWTRPPRPAATALARCSQDITVQLAAHRRPATGRGPGRGGRQRRLCLAAAAAGAHALRGLHPVRELHTSARSQVWLATDDASGSRWP
jgi:hypothetical protein